MSLFARRRHSLAPPPHPFVRDALPIASVMLGSLAPLAPVIATAPIVPPLGFVLFVAWRLLRPDAWPIWAAMPLGLFDDLYSGQPLGSGIALFAAAAIALDLIDARLPDRAWRQSWGIAAALLVLYLLLAALIARLLGPTPAPHFLGPQALASALAVPPALRVVAWLDRVRFGR